MPKEYTHCVKGEVKRGKSLKDAKRICAGMYWNRHHMTVKQAHAKGIEDISEPSLLDDLPSEDDLKIEEQTLLTIPHSFEVLAEEGAADIKRPFRYRGIASKDNVISSNGRLYTAEFNDAMMQRTNDAIAAEGVIVTVYARHAQAIGSFMSGSVHLQIGRVEKLFREGSEIKYDARLADTRDGTDAAVLIRDGYQKGSSIRSYDFESDIVTVGERQLERMLTAVLAGIDLAEIPGIPGAGIVQVLEESPKIETVLEEEEEMEFDFSKLTVEELQAKAPAIVEALLKDPKALLEKANGDLATAKLQLDAATATLAAYALKLAVVEAVQNPLTSLATKKLTGKVKTPAEITPEMVTATLEEARNEILVAAGIGLQDSGAPKNEGGKGADDGPSAKVLAEHSEILRYTS